MPSPFPGMDPYLEKPVLWQGFHNKLLNHIEEKLNKILPARYIANLEARCYLLEAEEIQSSDYLIPDDIVTRPTHAKKSEESSVAIRERRAPSYLIEIMPQEINEAFVEIVDQEADNRVVTAIELLSYSNKIARNKGRRLYLKKQRSLLQSNTHFLEIDLLRAGLHSVSMPEKNMNQPHRHDYIVCLYRAHRPAEYEIWPFTVRDSLPDITIPLGREVPEIVLDLQKIFEQCYDALVRSIIVRSASHRSPMSMLLGRIHLFE